MPEFFHNITNHPMTGKSVGYKDLWITRRLRHTENRYTQTQFLSQCMTEQIGAYTSVDNRLRWMHAMMVAQVQRERRMYLDEQR